MSDTTQAVAIIGTIIATWGLASLLTLGLHVWNNNDHNESHDWSDE